MNRKLLCLTAALFVGAALASPSIAQSRNCAAHDDVVQRLAAGYGESRQSIALGANNTVVEVFASEESGTWTITVTTPGGPTCLVAAGQAYQSVNEPLPSSDSGA
ncbi:hypothetical protein [Flavimaricola marinus]|nr:hypothetical protein [Flavimaricola marinus]